MSHFMKTTILRFPKKIYPPLFCYPISVIHNDWLPSEEFREMKNNIQKIFPHEIAESEEKDLSIVESLPEKRIYGNRFRELQELQELQEFNERQELQDKQTKTTSLHHSNICSLDPDSILAFYQ